jgi:hypothetical protein
MDRHSLRNECIELRLDDGVYGRDEDPDPGSGTIHGFFLLTEQGIKGSRIQGVQGTSETIVSS